MQSFQLAIDETNGGILKTSIKWMAPWGKLKAITQQSPYPARQ